MSRFRRRGRDRDDGAALQSGSSDEVLPDEDGPQGAVPTGDVSRREGGPWDLSEVEDPASRGLVDLGGVWLPGAEGMEIRVEVDQDSGAVSSITLVLAESSLEIGAFAAPRTEGIWADTRTEIAASLTQQGGTVDEVDGPFGAELRAKVPVQLPNGRSGIEPVRFLGVDGPRWFLRGVLTGRAAVEPAADAALIGLFQEIVVVRGTLPMAPREPIPLRLPQAALDPGQAGGAEGAEGAEGADDEDYVYDEDEHVERAEDLKPFERGPEITEIH